MKTAVDIQSAYPGTKTRTWGKYPVFACEVEFPDGITIKGYGQTLESSEDTAFYGAVITMREK